MRRGAETWPYLRDPWIETKGANRHHGSRLQFLRRWYADERLRPERMVGFELYPWHSTSVTAPIRRLWRSCASTCWSRSVS